MPKQHDIVCGVFERRIKSRRCNSSVAALLTWACNVPDRGHQTVAVRAWIVPVRGHQASGARGESGPTVSRVVSPSLVGE